MSHYREIDLTLTEKQQQLKNAVHQFARDILRPTALRLDKFAGPEQVIAADSELWSTLAATYQHKFHTALIPVEVGGLGLNGLDLHIALEELGWGSADFAISLAVTGFPFAMLAMSGQRSLIEDWVKPFVNDSQASRIGCWGLTEPAHGSDQFVVNGPQFRDPTISSEMTARAEGDFYVIHGQKAQWISNGTIATHAILYLNVAPDQGMAGNGIAFVPLTLPGVSKTKPLDKIGQRALNQGGIVFDNVRIPKQYLIVGADGYETALRHTLTLTNAAMGAIFTGVARAAYEEALAYTKVRVQGGKPICQHQLVQKHLFDMYTKVTNCRLLSRAAMVYNAAHTEQPALEVAVAAKVYCTQAAYEVADTAVQLFGGRGLSKDYLVEKLYRDARAALIEDGSNDVLTLVGAQEILR